MEQFRAGLGDGWASVATFLPKLVGFLIILIMATSSLKTSVNARRRNCAE